MTTLYSGRSLTALFALLLVGYLGQAQSFTMTQIAPNFFLDRAWDLQYGPDDHLWITEREDGKVIRVNLETIERDELITIPDHSSTAGQDGLLGMALHPGLLDDNPYVYLSYTYLVGGQRTQKLVRYTYSVSGEDGSLADPMIILDNLPCSNDHNSGRLVFGPDEKLYYSIGDQGANQGGNKCNPNLAQELPSQGEVDQGNWGSYPGKILRLNLDGSIPDDNPMFNGVRSHIYTIGHRNPQGLVFGSNGILYSDEHGPNTDDEVNVLVSGGNYGWPNIAGYQDDQAYDYCNWSSIPNCQSANDCSQGESLEESDFNDPNYQEPLLSMFAVTDDYNFNDPACSNSWICRPNVAPSSIDIYESDAIPEWKNSLLVTSLKRGRILRLKLNEDGTEMVGDTLEHFYSQNRYRDIALDPNGTTFYVITDPSGKTSDASGYNQVNTMLNPSTILMFTLADPSATQEPAEEVFRVWPNPAGQMLNLELKEASYASARADLVNTSGVVVRTYDALQTGRNELDLTPLPQGIYFVRLALKDKVWQQRILHIE